VYSTAPEHEPLFSCETIQEIKSCNNYNYTRKDIRTCRRFAPNSGLGVYRNTNAHKRVKQRNAPGATLQPRVEHKHRSTQAERQPARGRRLSHLLIVACRTVDLIDAHCWRPTLYDKHISSCMNTVSVDHAGHQGGCCVLLCASVPSVDDHACVHHGRHTAFHLACLPNVQRASPAVLLGRLLVSCT
jgi:hypothetical protein